jgi:hypothetical protein
MRDDERQVIMKVLHLWIDDNETSKSALSKLVYAELKDALASDSNDRLRNAYDVVRELDLAEHGRHTAGRH